MQLDPLSDKFSFLTPYQYAGCEPIANIDLDGLEPIAAGITDAAGWLPSVTVSVARQAPKVAKAGVTALSIASYASKALDIVTDVAPIIGPSKDIYRGIKNGDGWQIATGVEFLLFDVATLGNSVWVETIFKLSTKSSTEWLVRNATEQALKNTAKTGVGVVSHFAPETAEEGGRVFWSGGGNEAVEAAARQFATNNGMTTLEMTNAGKNLTNLTRGMSWTEKGPMWQRLSAQFTRGANGTVHVFQNAGGINVKSIWGTVEYPILKQNGINIIYHTVP